MLRTPISLMSTVLPPHANSFVIGPAVIKHTLKRSALSNSPQASAPPPSQAFTQCPYPPRSLVRDGQTSPDRPRLVVSRITCPPLSPHANSFVIGPGVIKRSRQPEIGHGCLTRRSIFALSIAELRRNPMVIYRQRPPKQPDGDLSGERIDCKKRKQ